MNTGSVIFLAPLPFMDSCAERALSSGAAIKIEPERLTFDAAYYKL